MGKLNQPNGKRKGGGKKDPRGLNQHDREPEADKSDRM